MSLKAKRTKQTSNSGMSNPVLEPDNYPARLVQVIDMGKRASFFDPEKINHEINLTYELVSEFMLDDKGQPVEDKPLWLSEVINMVDMPDHMTAAEIYADQFKSKGKLVQRCKTFDPKGELDFDLTEFLGKPCSLTVVNYKKKDDTIGMKIGAVTGLMKGMVIAELVNPPKVFALDEPDMTIFGSLPDWFQDKIKENIEFSGSPLATALAGGTAPATKAKAKASPATKAKPEPEEEEDDNDAPW
jgi:hypothetical protein